MAAGTDRFEEVWQDIYNKLIKLKEVRDAELRSFAYASNPTGLLVGGGAAAIEGGKASAVSRNPEPAPCPRRLEGNRDAESGRTVVAVRTGLPLVGQPQLEAAPARTDRPGKQPEAVDVRIGEARDGDFTAAGKDLAPLEEKGEGSGLEVLSDTKRVVVKDEGRKVREGEGVEVSVVCGDLEERWRGDSTTARADDGRGEEPGDEGKREPKLEETVTTEGEAPRKRKRDADDEDPLSSRAVSKNGKRKVVSFRTEGEGAESDAESEHNEKGNNVPPAVHHLLDEAQRRPKSTRRGIGDDVDGKYLNAGRLQAEEGLHAQLRAERVPFDGSVDGQVEAREAVKETADSLVKQLELPAADPGSQGLGKNEGERVRGLNAGSRDPYVKPSESGSLSASKKDRALSSDISSKSVLGEKTQMQPDLHVLTTAAAAIEADDNVGSAEAVDLMSIEAADERVPSNLSSEDGELAEQAILIKSLKGQKEVSKVVVAADEVVNKLVANLAEFVPQSVLGSSRDGVVALAVSVGQFLKKQQDALDRERKLTRVLQADLIRNHNEKERLQEEKDRLCAHLSSIATTVEEGSAACSYCQSIMSKLSEESFQDAFKTVSNEGGQVVPFEHQQAAFSRDDNDNAQSPLSSSSDGPVSANRKVVNLSDDEKDEASEPQLSNGKDVSGSSSGDLVPFKRKRRMEDVMEEDKPIRYSRRGKDAELKPSKEVKSSHDKSVEIRRSRRLSAKDYDQDLVEVDIKEVGDEGTDEEEEVQEPKVDEVEEEDREEEEREHKKRQSVKEVSKRLKASKGRAEVQVDNSKKSASKARRQEESTEDEKGEEKELIRRLKARTAKKEAFVTADKVKEKAPLPDKHANGTATGISSVSLSATASDSEDQGPKEEPELELKCGCTSSKYGDTVGHVKVYKSGDFVLFCECKPGCSEAGLALTPAAFERHAGRGSSKKWKNTIWVMMGDDKVPIAKVKALEPYYKKYKVRKNLKVPPTPGTGAATTNAGAVTPSVTHRDEFVKCCKCRKERRFKRRNKEECRLYHDAMLNRRWECANLPDERYARCGEDEEREVRRALKGCPRLRNCPGCSECVCLGCLTCRFGDCTCRTCSEFMANAVRFV